MEQLTNWIKHTRTYPPVEIYFQSNKEKQERRAQQICNPLFTLDIESNTAPAALLHNMWASWREFEVLVKLGVEGMRVEYVRSVAYKFIADAEIIIPIMEEIYKQEEKLNAFYKKGSLSHNKVSDLVYAEIRHILR